MCSESNWRDNFAFGGGLSQWPVGLGDPPFLYTDSFLAPSLLLKLIVTPVLIATATLVGRRWGHALSGWLVGLPLTSGPVVFFLALDQGSRFAAETALGIILGVASQAVFAVVYARLERDAGWPARLVAGTLSFALVTLIFRALRIPVIAEPILVSAVLVIAIAVMPRDGRVETQAVQSPSGDMALRMLVATALVIGLTTIAPYLGAYLSGLIVPFPLYAAVLAVFAHRQAGLAGATAVWRGLLFGLFSFLAFFTVLAATLVLGGIALGFVLAAVTATAVQVISLLALRTAAARSVRTLRRPGP